jgi:hypothetical protein
MNDTTFMKHINLNPDGDSIEIGTPGKGGVIKVYGNFSNVEEFKSKVVKALEVQKFTQALTKELI